MPFESSGQITHQWHRRRDAHAVEYTIYKPYPPPLLENNYFDLLTRSLDKLTAAELSNVDTTGCEGITDWEKLLDEKPHENQSLLGQSAP